MFFSELLPRIRHHDNNKSVNEVNCSDGEHEEEPEPKEEINFLVDNVERQNAEAVELLFAGRRADAVKCTTRVKVRKKSEKKSIKFFLGEKRALI